MALFAIEYLYDPTQAAAMDEVRPEHRAHLRSLHDAGQIKLVGSWVDDPHPGALIAVEANDKDAALQVLKDDPFLSHNFILERKVHQWNVIIGSIQS